ncbi:malectin-A [Bradysia coprophila]|uniref:malectin-A n=1 Tax=Bradysia coprophila TaxID=38358 RepID=UPI00187D990F|nr:malectin-A [Bradysia coprophila]
MCSLINIIVASIICCCWMGFVSAYELIYAINCGSNEPVKIDDILYDRDPLTDRIGIASDYGKQLMMIGRASQEEEILYQTERYSTNTFGYDLPVSGDGEYLLVLKFCEVYFSGPNLKVFDVVLNAEHTAVSDLDIYQQVGKGVAHDEYIYYTISRGKLFYKEEESEIRGGKVRVEFIKGYRDNPKINAIVLVKGDVENFKKLDPIEIEAPDQTHQLNDIESESLEYDEIKPAKQRKTSGPRQEDPYALDDSSVMLPVFIAIGAFIPLLFCLCKL